MRNWLLGMQRTFDGSEPAGGGAPAPAPAGGGAPADPGAAWYAGADAEIVGHFQNRGWDKLTPAEAAIKAAQAHREAERFVGAPADKLVRIADPKNEAEYKAMWQRLGAGENADAYDLSAVKTADGKGLDDALAATLKQSFAEANVPKDAAARVAASVLKHMNDQASASAADQAAAFEQAKGELAKNWGQNYEANLLTAKQAANTLGISPEAVAALEKEVGYPKVMDMFRKIGVAMGEDKFVNAGQGGTGVMTVDGAVARKAELMKDTSWVGRYLNGDATAVREMTSLNTIIVGDDTADARARGY